MDFKEISWRLSAVDAALIDKGYALPNCNVRIEPDDLTVYINTATQGTIEGVLEWSDGECFEDAFKGAEAKVAAIPSVEDHRKKTAVRDFGRAVDGLRDAGFEASFTDPLADTLQAMTENLLTHEASDD